MPQIYSVLLTLRVLLTWFRNINWNGEPFNTLRQVGPCASRFASAGTLTFLPAPPPPLLSPLTSITFSSRPSHSQFTDPFLSLFRCVGEGKDMGCEGARWGP
jgi:hypothetical protein